MNMEELKEDYKFTYQMKKTEIPTRDSFGSLVYYWRGSFVVFLLLRP
jgi:hypothetical protein